MIAFVSIEPLPIKRVEDITKFFLTGNENLKKTFWKPNVLEGHTVEKQCAMVEVKDSKIWWLPENCEEQHEFVCLYVRDIIKIIIYVIKIIIRNCSSYL